MAPASSSSPATTSVQVALRIRPPTAHDSTSIPVRFQRPAIHTTSATSVVIETSTSLAGAGAPGASTSGSSAPKKQSFTFDQVHPPPTTQYELFESTAKPLVSRFLDGFNCTILAYGQTSSGKTFTMTGIDLDADPSDPNNGMGIIPRAVSTMFSRAKQLKDERGGAWNYSVKGSFIEIYNEDLLDLLSVDDATGGKREVQIREDKDGHIIWGGLREVNVRNSSEVMNLIRKGTAIRRTNETDMNAQSSRSHAIFSLTLTQKKFTGSTPPRSSSPMPPAGRSPSRLARPGSMYAGPSGNRVGSPTLGRPSTPSFASAMGRGGGLRPSSALGYAGERSMNGDEDSGEWVTVVSKFHFVDLAGSERLKRTAAVGDRIKEGISINSGLLALGNVISALGDPARAKSNTATHIPYRDSKLTRLLQDSLGGNAHTLMVACVSPAEWNAAETINTLKYANRARNIKNRAVINEKEDGWDDVEWLQATVTRLRKEVKNIKEGKVIVESDKDLETMEGAGKRVLAQMTELQNNYEDLREKFVERTEELTRLRRELGEKQRSSTNGTIAAGTARYEEIVGPVIEEYEKAIATMEAELNLNRAALRHTNEMVEEKEEEFNTLTSRHAATELYVEELRTRIAKLNEREASTEAYVRDLEEKIKTYDENSVSSNESLADLKHELSRYKESESYSTKYIADLEARLSKSNESILAFQQTVERLEEECEKRRSEVDTLLYKLDALQKDGEGWRMDLEGREKRVLELEQKMVEWELKKKEASETRARLSNMVKEVVSAKRSLEDRSNNSSPQTTVVGLPDEETSSQTVAEVIPLTSEVEAQYLILQQTHTATLADLSNVTAKYRDALHEISELAAQLEEAKLGNTSINTTIESPATERPEFPQFKRRMTGARYREGTEPQFNASGRRLFFRQAASADSLHSRSLSQSVSLSQELSSVHSRKTSFSSHGTSSSHSPSSSYSHLTLHTSHSHSRANLSLSSPIAVANGHERTTSSLEKEIMRLQEVLKEREMEISSLEESIKENQVGKLPLQEDVETSHPENQNGVTTNINLSPKTLNHFDHIKQTMVNGHSYSVSENGTSPSESDESLDRLNELMLSMAQKESQHREIVEELNTELAQTKRQLDELTALSRDQALNMSKELEAIQYKCSGSIAEAKEYQSQLEMVERRKSELQNLLDRNKEAHQLEMEDLRQQHEQALQMKATEVEGLIQKLKEEQVSALDTLRAELEGATNALQQAQLHHEEAFGKLKAEYENQFKRQIEEANEVLASTQQEHQKTIAKLISDHNETLHLKDVEASATSQTTEEEYYNALTKLRNDHGEIIKKLNVESEATIERLREEHAGELRLIEIARQGSLSESESSRNLSIKELQDEHAAALARKEASVAEEIETLKATHIRVLQAKVDDHGLQMDRLRLEFESSTMRLKEEWRKEVESLTVALAEEKEAAAVMLSKAVKDSETALRGAKDQHSTALQELARGHSEDIDRLTAMHAAALETARVEAERDTYTLSQKHEEALSQLRTEFEEKLSNLSAELESTQLQHQDALKSVREESQQLAAEQATAVDIIRHSHLTEQENLRRLLEQQHLEEREKLRSELEQKYELEKQIARKEHDDLVQELEAHKAAAEEFTMLREQSRTAHENGMNQKQATIQALQDRLSVIRTERDGFRDKTNQLTEELENTRNEQVKLVQEASKRESLVMDLERHRSLIVELQENLNKVKDEKDNLQLEKSRQDSLVRDLQAQIARSASPPNVRQPERTLGYPRAAGLPPAKLPPPTPPPSIPPPPAPRLHGELNLSISSQSSSNHTFSTSKESQPESPSTSLGHPPLNGSISDPKLTAKIEKQMKTIEEQETMIKTLNKQLSHCESDLQAHMDLVNTLETSLGDAEKNLRKARMQATELARERDTLNGRVDSLRNELMDARNEVTNVRRSIVEEKQSLELRLDEERKAKERVRQQLDLRMEELQKRKSKFSCL